MSGWLDNRLTGESGKTFGHVSELSDGKQYHFGQWDCVAVSK